MHTETPLAMLFKSLTKCLLARPCSTHPLGIIFPSCAQGSDFAGTGTSNTRRPLPQSWTLVQTNAASNRWDLLRCTSPSCIGPLLCWRAYYRSCLAWPFTLYVGAAVAGLSAGLCCRNRSVAEEYAAETRRELALVRARYGGAPRRELPPCALPSGGR